MWYAGLGLEQKPATLCGVLERGTSGANRGLVLAVDRLGELW
jgi:hypothetical protein